MRDLHGDVDSRGENRDTSAPLGGQALPPEHICVTNLSLPVNYSNLFLPLKFSVQDLYLNMIG